MLLGDDSMLTLFAFGRGRALQRLSAVCFAMYPENLSHTLRQWTRWTSGMSIRAVWQEESPVRDCGTPLARAGRHNHAIKSRSIMPRRRQSGDRPTPMNDQR